MNFIASTFDRVGGLYASMFADWLHVHFIIRTVIVLLILWLFIFLAAQAIQFAIAPLILLLYHRIISRDPYVTYREMLFPARRFATHFMLVMAVAATLWVTAFGLHHEYAAPVMLEVEPAEFTEEYLPPYYEEMPYYIAESEIAITPSDWDEDTVLILNEYGQQGARLRDGPGIAGQTVVEILWDDATLIFRNAYVPDEYVRRLYWLRVESPSGTVGYISSRLVENMEENS